MIGYLKNYATSLLRQVGYRAPVAVRWEDQATASTDGLRIAMPREFLGVTLDTVKPKKRAVWLAKGLILHEIGHSLQPLEAINKVEADTKLHHAYVNLILDVHLERVALKVYKSEAKYLIFLRKFIKRKMMQSYLTDYAQIEQYEQTALADGDTVKLAEFFAQKAEIINLVGRYNIAKKGYSCKQKINDSAITGRLRDYHRAVFKTPMQGNSLCGHLRMIANRYPELCNDSLDLPDFPGMQKGMFGGGLPTNDKAATELAEAGQRAADILETIYLDLRRGRPEREAIPLAAKLALKLKKVPATRQIIAPVIMNRRKLAIGDDQPWHMNVKTGHSIKRHMTIVYDVSASMGSSEGSRLRMAMIASQALCIAVESAGGSVCGGQFGAYGVLSSEMDASPLFCGVVASRRETNFQLLASVWLHRPDDTVIVITDGSGSLPNLIKPEDKERTHIICLGGLAIHAVAQMGTVHVLQDNELDKLPEIMLNMVN